MGEQPEATPSSAADGWAALSLGLGRCWVLDVVSAPGPAVSPSELCPGAQAAGRAADI